MDRAAPEQVTGVLPATPTTDIGTFQLAPRATLGIGAADGGNSASAGFHDNRRWRLAHGDDPERLSIPFSPSCLSLQFLALAADVASSCGYQPCYGGLFHNRSDLAAGTQIRLRTAGSRVQVPEGQNINLFPTTVRPPLEQPSLLFDSC